MKKNENEFLKKEEVVQEKQLLIESVDDYENIEIEDLVFGRFPPERDK